jgi:hypothetical protein
MAVIDFLRHTMTRSEVKLLCITIMTAEGEVGRGGLQRVQDATLDIFLTRDDPRCLPAGILWL